MTGEVVGEAPTKDNCRCRNSLTRPFMLGIFLLSEAVGLAKGVAVAEGFEGVLVELVGVVVVIVVAELLICFERCR